MLYVTTRNPADTYTVNHTLEHSRGVDGGFWIPFRAPSFSPETISELKEQPFNGTIANILNTLFGTKLTVWDVDFCIGRYPVRFEELNGRVIVAEPWHNPQWTFENVVIRLTKLIGGDVPGSWPQIAVRIAILFGCYGELLRKGILAAGETVDISVLSGDFIDPMSAWYARSWGLPIENIIYCCNENNNPWNLICQGQMRTDGQSIQTCIPAADIVHPRELERFVYACGGSEALQDYLTCTRCSRTYIPSDMTLSAMQKGVFVSVVSSHRISQIISGVYASHGYLLSPEGALNYAGLQDYRTKKGQIRTSLVMTQNSPVYGKGCFDESAGTREDTR